MILEVESARTFCDEQLAGGIGGSGSYALFKAIVDRTTATVLLVAAAPLILGLIALVRMTSRGPAIYRQVRLGLDGRPYSIYKLRSMFVDSELASGAVWSRPGDPRVTPLGRILRKTHLDELPQLWNVIRGDMSLVGPRPERPEFVGTLEEIIPGYRGRMTVRPGITGLAQIQLPPDEDYDGVRRKITYDLYYVRAANLSLDFQILIGTALKITGVSFEAIRRIAGLPAHDEVLGYTIRTAPTESLPRAEPATVVG